MATKKHITVGAAAAAALAAVSLVPPDRSAQAVPAAPACVPAGPIFAATAPTSSGPRLVRWAPDTDKTRSGYGWPIKPFNRQHPVRAFFNDPRIYLKTNSLSFHFGVDIAAPDMTPVYSVEPGTVQYANGRALRVVAGDGSHAFAYWHIVPAVRNGQWVGKHQLLGRIDWGSGHVHFAEERGHQNVNPLRKGALTPYVDHTAPTVKSILAADAGGGKVEIVSDAFDTTIPRVPGAWRDLPVTPVLVQWRAIPAGASTTAWKTGVDFRAAKLPNGDFGRVYGKGTLQNRKGTPGRYCLRVVRDWHPKPGAYRIQVRAVDTWGNIGRLDLPVRITPEELN